MGICCVLPEDRSPLVTCRGWCLLVYMPTFEDWNMITISSAWIKISIIFDYKCQYGKKGIIENPKSDILVISLVATAARAYVRQFDGVGCLSVNCPCWHDNWKTYFKNSSSISGFKHLVLLPSLIRFFHYFTC